MALSVSAQTDTARMHKKNYTRDADLPRWALDINGLFGTMSQDLTVGTSTAGYVNGLNLNTGKLKFEKGSTIGFDVQLGYFFGPKCHWGLGTGFMYLGQKGNMMLDAYHVEYQATDAQDRIFRQIVTGKDLKEEVKISNMNIPLMLKYKYRFSKALGFTADAGALFNVTMKNTATQTGTFDYEAAYHWNAATTNGLPTTYDNNPTFDPNSEVITRAYFVQHNPDGNVDAYFKSQAEAGAPVALGVKPANEKSTTSYTSGSVGFMVRPELSWYWSDNVAMNFGVYYIYQSFKNSNDANYMLVNTDRAYTTTIKSVSASNVQSFGGTVGLRFLFGKPKDTDKDGIPDKKDKCPEVWGLAEFQGCPDTDKDGITDAEDSCRTVPGILKFHGCPDSDGDGLADKDDECPYQAGPIALKGCPDRDGDGIADKVDACPDKPGLAQYKGCPDTDGDGLPDNEDQCPEVAGPASNNGCPLPPPPPPAIPLSTPILFETNSTIVQQASMPVLEVAIKTMSDDAEAIVVVHGHADSRGTNEYNKKLSLKRAQAVKKQLVSMGANPKRIKVVAHGETDPVASNSTPEGMAENRRAVMRLSVE